MRSLLRSLPVQLIAAIVFVVFAGHLITTTWVEVFYTVSWILKEVLIFTLPIIVFAYMTAAISSLKEQALWLLIAMIGLLTLSNAVGAYLAFGLGSAFLDKLISPQSLEISMASKEVIPLFSLNLPRWIGTDHAMLLGLAVGISINLTQSSLAMQATRFRTLVTKCLQKVFIPLLPVYVFGFLLKLRTEGQLQYLLVNYWQVLTFSTICVLNYLILMYGVGTHFKPAAWVSSLKNMLPAGITGFCTMSSAATMPVTLEASRDNLEQKELADLVIPATASIHLVGDAISVPLTALSLLIFAGLPLPDIFSYSIFVAYFCLAKFSTAAVPGGGIIVMLPILQNYLNLTSELASIMTALYILQDPLFTSANVMGNGAFVLIFERFSKFVKRCIPSLTKDSSYRVSSKTL